MKMEKTADATLDWVRFGPYSGHTIKQGHLGTDNSTRGEQKGGHVTEGDSYHLEIGDRSQQNERKALLSLP
eukprot:scaffold19937_cov127-Isochrysis_galbana.AAC.9